MLELRHGTLVILQEPGLWVLGEAVLSLLWVTGIGSFQTPHCPSLSQGFPPDLSPVGITMDACQTQSCGWLGQVKTVLSTAALVSLFSPYWGQRR